MRFQHCKIMNKGKFIFSQVIDFLPRYEFDKIVNKYMQIANIYRNRWQIETFFKWIKGNLTIKALWGDSENAVKIQLWVAICTYLLVAIIKAKCGSDYSITEVEMLLRVSVFERMNIRDLLTRPADQLLNQNQNIKELSLFLN